MDSVSQPKNRQKVEGIGATVSVQGSSLSSDSVLAHMGVDSAADVVQSENPRGEEMVVDESQEMIPDGDLPSELSDGEDIRVGLARNWTSFSIRYLNRLISKQLSKI